MQFFIRNLQGRSLVFEAQPSDTIRTIKSELEDRESIPVGEQTLIYQGRQLDDYRSLLDYGVSRDSTLHLTASLRGGFTGGSALPLIGAVAGTVGGTAGGVVGTGIATAGVGAAAAAAGGTATSVGIASVSAAAPGVLTALGFAGPFGWVIGAGAIVSAGVIIGMNGEDDYTCWQKIVSFGEVSAAEYDEFACKGMPLEALSAHCNFVIHADGTLVARNKRREEYALKVAKVTAELVYLHAERFIPRLCLQAA